MNAVSALIALLVIFAAGFGATMLLFKKRQPVPFVELFALSWLLGALFVSVALPCLGIFCSGLALQWLVTLAAILAGWQGLKSLRKSGHAITWPRPANPLETALCFVLLVEFMVMLFMAARESLGWDGLLVWEIKARYAFLNGGHLPLRYFVDETRLWSHPDYPLFLPMLETWLYLWIGDCDQFWVRIIFPPFYIAAAFLLYLGASRLSGKRWIGLLAAALLFFLPCALTGEGNLLAGYADFPLAVLYLASVVYFLDWKREASFQNTAIFSIIAGAMPWMKHEGIVLWACMMAQAVFQFARRRNFQAALLVPLPGLALWAGWNIATKILKVPANTDFLPLSFHVFRANAHRYGSIVREICRELSNPTHWSILWLVFLIAVPLLLVKLRQRVAIFLSLSAVIPVCFYSGVYIFSAWPSYMDHIQTSFPRLALQVSLVALLTISISPAAGRKEGLWKQARRSPFD